MSEDTATDYRFVDIKVMILDASKTIRGTADLILQKAGCKVITAVDGFESLALIVDQKPDIIFLDIMMPRLDGYQTCAVIKHNLDFQAIPIIMMPCKDGPFDKVRAHTAGADHYLHKPFMGDELLAIIKCYVIDPRNRLSKDKHPTPAVNAAINKIALTG